MSNRRKTAVAKRKQPPAKKQNHNLIHHQQQTTSYSGPLPSADEMAKYDSISPTVVERIMTLAEGEANHRRDIESQAVSLTGREVLMGQVFGLMATMSGFVLSGYAFYLGHPTQGAALVGAVLLGLVTVFIKGRGK